MTRRARVLIHNSGKVAVVFRTRSRHQLFGTSVSLETNAAFVADNTPGALGALAERLLHRPGPEIHAWAGPLSSRPTTFQVLPADPEATK
jgi:hypothetical protein